MDYAEMQYGLRCTVQPVLEPVTLSQFKLAQRIIYDHEDVTIRDLLKGAREYIETITGRRFITQTWQLTLDGFPCWEIRLPVGPVQSVSSVTYTAEDGTTTTLSPSLYLSDVTRDVARLTPAYGEAWPSHRRQLGSVNITFVAGYGGVSSVPDFAKGAIRHLAAHKFENREPIVVGTSLSSLPWHLQTEIGALMLSGSTHTVI